MFFFRFYELQEEAREREEKSDHWRRGGWTTAHEAPCTIAVLLVHCRTGALLPGHTHRLDAFVAMPYYRSRTHPHPPPCKDAVIAPSPCTLDHFIRFPFSYLLGSLSKWECEDYPLSFASSTITYIGASYPFTIIQWLFIISALHVLLSLSLHMPSSYSQSVKGTAKRYM